MNEIPIPKHALGLLDKLEASEKIGLMQFENILLRHLVDTLDPEHDYVFDRKEKKLIRSKRDDQVQPSTGQKITGREEGAPSGESRGFNINDKRSIV